MLDNKIINLSFFAFNIGESIERRGGGTGVFIASIEEILDQYHQEGRIRLKKVGISSLNGNSKGKLSRFFATIYLFLKDLIRIYLNKSDLIVLVYPKIPILAQTNNPEYILIAIFGYFLFHVKKFFSKTKLAIIIEDLPVEQAQTILYHIPPFRKRLIRVLERMLFAMADKLLAPSTLLAEYVNQKYQLSTQWIIYPRDMYMPLKDTYIKNQIEPDQDKINVFYSGGVYSKSKSFFLEVIDEFEKSEKGILFICGIGLEWLTAHIKKNNLHNIRYIGVLNYLEHDFLASRCDFGLIIYPQNSYCDFKPTTKYSAYLSNGLPILSNDLKTIKKIFKEDGTGLAVHERYFKEELQKWLNDKVWFLRYTQAAQNIRERFNKGEFMRVWVEPLLKMVKE